MSKVIRCPLCKVKLFKISTDGQIKKMELRCLRCKRPIIIRVSERSPEKKE